MGGTETIIIVAISLVIVFIAVLAARRVILARSGSFEVSWRFASAASSRGWTLGQARYRRNRLTLYRVFSPLPFATVVLTRAQTMVGSARKPDEVDRGLLPPDSVIVSCSCGPESFDLALPPGALMGLRAWVESHPPGMQSGLDV